MKKTIFTSLAVLSCGFFAYGAPVELEPDDHTVAFWDLSIQKKNVIQDQSGFGNDLQFRSLDKAPLPVIKKDEGAIFDAQGGILEVKPKESLRIKKGDFTMEIVFKCGEKVNQKTAFFFLLGNKSHTEKNSGFNLNYGTWQGKKFSFGYTLNGKAQTFSAPVKQALVNNQWYHLILTRNGDKLAMFLDGVLLAEKEVKGDINLIQNRNLRVGIYPAPWQRTKDKKLKTDGFVGTIRYIKISDKAKVK
jgi:hypothetical protein